jgi:CheY-like chemotaxis protein
MADQLPSIQADRIVLRQILFTMLGYALRLYPDGDVTISAQVHPERVVLCGRARPASPAALPAVLDDAPLHIARFWAQRFGAKLTIQRGSQGDDSVQLLLSWPRAEQPVVMVVDDQEPAIRLFQRYLSRASVRVVGVREPEQVLPMARKLRPAVITLDVMMPTTDGWEVLQSILSDPDTRHIPVVICSVWDEPELALSFGATAFLKKPITQRDLLDALQRLSIVDRPGAQSSVNN